MREITYTEAVLEAFREEMRRDSTIFHLCGGLGALWASSPEFPWRAGTGCAPSQRTLMWVPVSSCRQWVPVLLSARG